MRFSPSVRCEELGCAAIDLLARELFDALAEHPLPAERIPQPPAALAVEVVLRRIVHLCSGRQSALQPAGSGSGMPSRIETIAPAASISSARIAITGASAAAAMLPRRATS